MTTKSGKDTEIIGSTATGDKIDMTVDGNLHIETLQDVDNYHETSHSSGFSIDMTKGLSPNLGMPAHGDDKNTTHAAIAPGNIEIRNGQKDISGLSRDTQNALSTLGKIFDKSTIEEQQELAKVFGEEAYKLAHNMKDDGSARKIAVHAAIGGIMSQITGAGFASGAIGAGVNEAIIEEIGKIKDPGTAQTVSSIVGTAAAKVAGGNAGAGATAASGTRNNHFLIDKAKSIIEEESQELLDGVKNEAIYLVRNGFLNPGAMEADYYVINISLPIKIANVGCIIDKYGNVYCTVAINLLSASVGVPISTGEGWLLTKNRDTSQNFIGSITGLCACISAIGGVGGTLTLSLSSLGEGAAELDSSVSAGLAVGGAWTDYIGNVWEWLNE